jgi:hypothetical protein
MVEVPARLLEHRADGLLLSDRSITEVFAAYERRALAATRAGERAATAALRAAKAREPRVAHRPRNPLWLVALSYNLAPHGSSIFGEFRVRGRDEEHALSAAARLSGANYIISADIEPDDEDGETGD